MTKFRYQIEVRCKPVPSKAVWRYAFVKSFETKAQALHYYEHDVEIEHKPGWVYHTRLLEIGGGGPARAVCLDDVPHALGAKCIGA